MFHRCILLFVIASLAVSGGAAWATSIFVNVNAHNALSNRDLQAWPAGVSAGGAVVLPGATDHGQSALLHGHMLLSWRHERDHDEHDVRIHPTTHEDIVKLHE